MEYKGFARAGVFVATIIFGLPVLAAPIVIKDYGGTSTDVPSMQALRDAYAEGAPDHDSIQPQKPINPFPMLTKVQSGVLQAPVRLAARTPKPLFIVGADELSLRWFERNKQYLLSVQATGYAVNIISEHQMLQLSNRLAPLQAVPLPLDEAAQKLGIPVYPVLIIGNEIKQ